jgi:hypothetical protein
MAFLDAEKYPPSLVFMLMTLGPTLILLGVLDKVRFPRWTAWLAVIGTVPLFFYLLQWFAVHGLAVAMEAVAGRSIAWHFATPPERFAMTPPDAGFPLPVVYLVWIAVVVTLYVPCRAYAHVRARRGGFFRYL